MNKSDINKSPLKIKEYIIMTAKRRNLSLSGLITEMHNIIHNNDWFCFSDFAYNIDIIASMQEKKDDFILFWGIRQNGTKMANYFHEVECWALSCNSQEIHQIRFENGIYSIESIRQTGSIR